MLSDVLSRELSDALNLSWLRVRCNTTPNKGVGCGGGDSCGGKC